MTVDNSQQTVQATAGDPEAPTPIERTFRDLVISRRPNAGAVIAYAVGNSRGETQRLAVSAALDRGERDGLEGILRIFHQVPEDLQAASVARSEVFLPILRNAARDEDRQLRANACDFLIRMDDARVAYLLAGLMQDPVEQIKKRAQDGILSLAFSYHTLAAQVESGHVKNLSRHALEAKRYALLDALLTAVRFYKSHERPEIMAALMSLSPRGDEVLMDILANPMDRRRKVVLEILETATFPRAVTFLLNMLRNAKAASTTVEILETRFDIEFLGALMANPLLFSNARITAGLSQVRFVPWLRPGTEKASQLPGRLAVRAVRFLLFSGASVAEKVASLEKLASSPNVALASASRFVVTALQRHIHPDKIEAGLLQVEGHCPPLEAECAEPEPDKLIVAKAAPQRTAGSARFLSDEALLRNFVNSFDTMGKAEKDSSIDEFRSRGMLLRELKKVLNDPEVETVRRAMKVIEHVGCQNDVSSELVFLTKHNDGRVRSAAVRQLGKAGVYDAMKTLFEILADRDRRVLANAIEALEATGNKHILRLLEPLLKHPDNRVRANAAKAAWTLGSQQGLDCLVDMLGSQKPNMRLSALWGLRQIGAKEQMQTIREMAKSDPDERVRKSAELTVAELENVL